MNKIVEHGGDLDFIERNYKISRNNIVDFSGNINPFGAPDKVKDTIIKNIHLIETYPDAEYTKLREKIGNYTNNLPENIVVGSGATEIIRLIIRSVNPKKAMLVLPTYSEYKKEIILNGGQTTDFALYESENFQLDVAKLIENITTEIDMVILCNPNNPTGNAIDLFQLEKIVSYCAKKNTFLMVDETYAEFTSDTFSATSLVKKYPNLMVIRGTSKFFAVPGIRMGYGICSNKPLLEKIYTFKEPWTINSLAEVAGISMFDDKDFIQLTKNHVQKEKLKFYDFFENNPNFYAFKSESNFILVKILNNNLNSDFYFDKCIKNSLLIRNAKNIDSLSDRYFRICILSEENNDRLIKVLS